MSLVDLYDNLPINILENNITKDNIINDNVSESNNSIGFYVIITKPNKHKITTKIINDIGKNMIEIKNKIVYIIQEEISKLKFNCDFPDSYEKFINTIWYNQLSADAEPFEYKIFNCNEWVSPWDIEDLFDEAVEILHKIDVLNAIIVESNKDEEEFEDDVEEEIFDTQTTKKQTDNQLTKTAFDELKEFFAEDN